MKSVIFGLMVAFFFMNTSFAQVVTGPAQPNQSNVIASSNQFQQVFNSNKNRHDCIIQNNSSANTMIVYFGKTADASSTNGLIIPKGTILHCLNGVFCPSDPVQITGTGNDAFVAVEW